MDLLQVPDDGLDTPVGVRPHANSESANKDKLQPFYVEKALANGKSAWVLNFSGYHVSHLPQLFVPSHW